MAAWSDLSPADLEDLKAVIARSPILLRRLNLDTRLADWAATRNAPDVDAVILAWLADQARIASRRLDA
jgi:hypothetical protein